LAHVSSCPFRANGFIGWFPGLKPWAKSWSPFGAINRPKRFLSSRHSGRPLTYDFERRVVWLRNLDRVFLVGSRMENLARRARCSRSDCTICRFSGSTLLSGQHSVRPNPPGTLLPDRLRVKFHLPRQLLSAVYEHYPDSWSRLGCLLKDKMRTALLGQIIADGKAGLATANDNGVCVFFHFSFLEVLVS